MMFEPQQRRSSNNNYSCRSKVLNLQLATRLLLCVQLSLCCWPLLSQTVDAAELPAELMLEGVSLLKSMEYAQERQHQQQQQQQKQQQTHYHQKPHFLHSQLKRFTFDPNTAVATATAAGSDADIDGMQAPAMSPGDIARFERELFLQSAIDDVPLNDEMELPPLEADSMEHADLMERAIDYKQHQPSPSSMWLQQPHNSGKGGDSKMASSTFLKMHQPINQQKQHQKHSKHHLSGDIAANANSDTLVPPPSPVAEPQRHCAIEISTKLTGVCQAMAPIGSACVAGDYMDVYNQDCL